MRRVLKGLIFIILICTIFLAGYAYVISHLDYPDANLTRKYSYYYSGSVALNSGSSERIIRVLPESRNYNYPNILYRVFEDYMLLYDTNSKVVSVLDLLTKRRHVIVKVRHDADFNTMSTDGVRIILSDDENSILYNRKTAKYDTIKGVKKYVIDPSGDGAFVVQKSDGSLWFSDAGTINTLRLLLNSTANVIWTYDFKHYILYTWNPKLRSLVAYDSTGNETSMYIPHWFSIVNIKYMPNYDELWVAGTRTCAVTQWIVYDRDKKLIGKIGNAPSSIFHFEQIQ